MDPYRLTHSLSVFFFTGGVGRMAGIAEDSVRFAHSGPSHNLLRPASRNRFLGDVEVFMCVCPQKCLVLWMREVPRWSCP